MSNWRPVDVRLWGDRKFLAGSDDARLLWLFLLTCPSLPIPGVVLGGDAALAELLGWTVERLRERFSELLKNGLQVRREGRIVWLPNALKYQTPRNPNMVKGWAKKWDDVPEGDLKLELWEAIRIKCKSWSILFSKLFAKPTQGCSTVCLSNSHEVVSAHDHYHEHDHKNDHDTEKNTLACAILPTPVGTPQLDRTVTDLENRKAVQREVRSWVEQARAGVASEHGLENKGLLAQDSGEADLAMHLVSAGPDGLAKAREQALHAVAIKKLEATRDRSLKGLTMAIFREPQYSELVSMGESDVSRSRSGHRRDAAAPPKRDHRVGQIQPGPNSNFPVVPDGDMPL